MRHFKGITELVKLFNSDNQEVQRFATGATRNLIYENMDNKVALIEEGGIPQLVEALKEPDDELRKNITGRKILITVIVIKKHDTTSRADLRLLVLPQGEMNAKKLVTIFGRNMISAVVSLEFFERTVAFEIDIIPHQTNKRVVASCN